MKKSLEEGRTQFDVNVFGAVRLIQLVLPHMRARQTGTIVNITSMGGKIHTPLGSLVPRNQVRTGGHQRLPSHGGGNPFGINVVVVEPVASRPRADIAAQNCARSPARGLMVTRPSPWGVHDRRASRQRQSPPELIADTIAKAVQTRRPKTRYAVGFGARPMIFLRRLLPDRAFDRFMRLATGSCTNAADPVHRHHPG